MGKFEIPKINFLKTELDYHSSQIFQTEWKPISIGTLRSSSQFSYCNSFTKFPFSLKLSPLPFPLKLLESVPLKLSLLRTQRLNL